MNSTRGLSAGIAGLAALTIALGGCAGGDGTAPAAGGAPAATSTAPAIPADPREALTKSVVGVTTDPHYKFTASGQGTTVNGVVHAPSRSMSMVAEVTGETPMKIEMLYFEPADTFLRTDMFVAIFAALGNAEASARLGEHGLDGKKWLKFDAARAKDFERIDFTNADLTGVSSVIEKGVATVEQSGEGAYKGTLDLTKVEPSDYLLDSATLTAIGSKPVPFTAKVDAQGRLTQFVLDMPAVGEEPAGPLAIDISEYGAATAPAKPTTDVVVAGDEAYSMLSGN